MIVNLKTNADKQQAETIDLIISERLPSFIEDTCHLTCDYSVQACGDFYLLNLKVAGNIKIICQRCLNSFFYTYHHDNLVAACDSDESAEQLMANHECIVVSNHQVNLADVLTDDLFLFLPETHPDHNDCDKEIAGFIRV